MSRRYIMVYFDWITATKALTYEEKGRLIDGMIAYACGMEYTLTGNEKFVFPVFQAQLDRDIESYADVSQKRRSASEKRWKKEKASDSISTQKDANASRSMQYKDKDEYKDKDKEVIKPRKRSRFIPPTLQQVSEFISECGLSVDAQRFFSYYETNGWRVGRNPMQDWKAALCYWNTQGNGGIGLGRDAVARSDSATDDWSNIDPERKRLFERAFAEGT